MKLKLNKILAAFLVLITAVFMLGDKSPLNGAEIKLKLQVN